jgi:hypothetical protein
MPDTCDRSTSVSQRAVLTSLMLDVQSSGYTPISSEIRVLLVQGTDQVQNSEDVLISGHFNNLHLPCAISSSRTHPCKSDTCKLYVLRGGHSFDQQIGALHHRLG